MKYKIIKSDLFLNGKLIPENSEVELTDGQIKGIEDHLLPCPPAKTSVKAGHSVPAPVYSQMGLSGEESTPGTFVNNLKIEKEKTKRGKK